MEFNNPSQIIKDITTGNEGYLALKKGVDILADAVQSTLGASGKCVIYEDAMGKPVITKDGVTVAESVILFDPVENMGATLIKEAASNTVKEAGDGTTTATVLARALLQYGHEALSDPSITIRDLKQAYKKHLSIILEKLDEFAKPLGTDKLQQIATISTNNDANLGELIADAFDQAGEFGEVLMEPNGDDDSTWIEYVSGAQIPSKLKSQYWRTSTDREVAELDKPNILILTSPLNSLRKIQPILEHCVKKNESLLIVGELEQQPLATLLSNKVKGVLKVNVVDLPGFGKTKQDSIKDLEIVTGATAISEELGDDFDFIDVSVLGKVHRTVTDNQKTVFSIEGQAEDVAERIEQVRQLIEEEKNGYIKKKLEDRLAILAGSVSVIKVGGTSEIERKERIDRVEDALYAVKAAIKEGYVSGGGQALLSLSQYLFNKTPADDAFIKAIQTPYFVIIENAEQTPLDADKLNCIQNFWSGIDVITGEVVDMEKHGIIDPVLVTKTALKNAVSVATTILSADAIISNKRIN